MFFVILQMDSFLARAASGKMEDRMGTGTIDIDRARRVDSMLLLLMHIDATLLHDV